MESEAYLKAQVALAGLKGAVHSLLAKDMSLEEAEEHFKRNIEGSYSGKSGPIFVTPFA